MHVHELRAENFKRIEVVRVDFPQAGTFEVCGENRQGKSSLIDALYAALGGKASCPELPIRSGAKRASSVVDLGDLIVIREWTNHGTSLTVTDKSGVKQSSPQKVLDTLISKFAFDPLEFTRLKDRDQAEILKKIAGLDFKDLDEKREEFFRRRAEQKRIFAQQDAYFCSLPEVEPTEAVDFDDLVNELHEVTDRNRKAQSKIADRDFLRREVKQRRADVERIMEDLKKAEERLQRSMESLESAERDCPEEEDTSEIQERIREAGRINARHRSYLERTSAGERVDMTRLVVEELTAEICKIDDRKQAMMEGAAFPVDGLTIEDDSVCLDGVPFSQVSTSDRIRVGLQIAAAMNPELKLIVVRDGSLLDEMSLFEIGDWAEREGYQVIVERVSRSSDGVGIVLEEGRVKEVVGSEDR